MMTDDSTKREQLIEQRIHDLGKKLMEVKL